MREETLEEKVRRWIAEGPTSMDLTDHGEIVGTPGYIAPEVLLAQGWTADLMARASRIAGTVWDDVDERDLDTWSRVEGASDDISLRVVWDDLDDKSDDSPDR